MFSRPNTLSTIGTKRFETGSQGRVNLNNMVNDIALLTCISIFADSCLQAVPFGPFVQDRAADHGTGCSYVREDGFSEIMCLHLRGRSHRWRRNACGGQPAATACDRAQGDAEGPPSDGGIQRPNQGQAHQARAQRLQDGADHQDGDPDGHLSRSAASTCLCRRQRRPGDHDRRQRRRRRRLRRGILHRRLLRGQQRQRLLHRVDLDLVGRKRR